MLEIVEEKGSDETVVFLENALLQSLRAENEQGVNHQFVLTIRDETGTIVSGLVGAVSYGWLLVKILWVKEEFRGRGLGRRLVEVAEQKALDRDCHAVWLDTSSPTALDFYRALGFEIFGTLANARGCAPEGHQCWFLRRTISAK